MATGETLDFAQLRCRCHLEYRFAYADGKPLDRPRQLWCVEPARSAVSSTDTTVYADLLYGSGLRSGFANTDELPGYYPLNLGFTHTFHLPDKEGQIRLRFDVTNVFDQSYQLRNGTGIGVFAPQFGLRRGFFGGVSWIF